MAVCVLWRSTPASCAVIVIGGPHVGARGSSSVSLLRPGRRHMSTMGRRPHSAYFAATFVFYWWHRWRHESDWLWRHLASDPSQRAAARDLHDVLQASAWRCSSIRWSTARSCMRFSDCPSRPERSMRCCTATGEFFYPRQYAERRSWIGYVYQRPGNASDPSRVSACHRSNYGDIVWWDMLFGTYENPPAWNGRCGFDAVR